MIFQPSARVIEDSISSRGKRITTLELTMHRFVLPEFATHRLFSKNSASSRAIPYSKMRAKVMDSLALPVEWRAEKSGMQGGDFLSADNTNAAMDEWQAAAMSAVHHADQLHELKVHKSICNRLLEPFIPHVVLVTATEWSNFYKLRLHEEAQPEIRVLAEVMKEAYDANKPIQTTWGDWHLPLIQEDEFTLPLEELKKLAVARCARVSYLTHDGIRDRQKDFELYERLKTSGHWSPFEHVATPTMDHAPLGNFVGWRQYRHEVEYEL